MTTIRIMICAIILPGVAAAHPDHATGEEFGLLHYLSDPFHVGLTAMALMIFLGVRRSMLRRRSLDRAGQ